MSGGRLWALGVALITALVFLPGLHNGFTSWDDLANFLENPYYRGLGFANLRWMFANLHHGHYIPLTWLTLGLDYALWGMRPAGYHLTSLILHSANAALFYFLARRLLALASPPRPGEEAALCAAAALAALAFSLHPLRVESVAWVTARRDVLSGLFALACALAYLDGRSKAALACFALAALARENCVALALVLPVLDLYPLRRLPPDPRRWLEPGLRPLWREKLPFLLVGAAVAAVALYGALSLGALQSAEGQPPAKRLAQAAYQLAFHLRKTVLPAGLSPLYEFPVDFDPLDWPYLLSAALVAAVGWKAWELRRRRPALLAAFAAYALLLSPTLGIADTLSLAYDRFSYLSCAGWAVLAGGAWRRLERARVAGLLRPRQALFAGGAVLAGLGVLALSTHRQIGFWRDPVTLWQRAVHLDPYSPSARNNLGIALYRQRGDSAAAVREYELAIRLAPRFARPRYNLGLQLLRLGRHAEAAEQLRQAVRLDPGFTEAYLQLGKALAFAGDYRAALVPLARVAGPPGPGPAAGLPGPAAGLPDAGPDDVRLEARMHLAWTRTRLGDLAGAVEDLERALAIRPNLPEAHNNLGNALMRLGREERAMAHFRMALRLSPDLAEAHNNLGKALLRRGSKTEAREHLEEALRLRPGDPIARRNLGLPERPGAGPPGPGAKARGP